MGYFNSANIKFRKLTNIFLIYPLIQMLMNSHFSQTKHTYYTFFYEKSFDF